MGVQEWRDQAKCVGMPTEKFFPEHLKESRFDDALRICATCPVSDACLKLVIGLDDVDDKWGVFGGTTPRQRKHIRHELERGQMLADAMKVGKDVGRSAKR